MLNNDGSCSASMEALAMQLFCSFLGKHEKHYVYSIVALKTTK
jgi:hypothetical protein